jgi:hypothetical protein
VDEATEITSQNKSNIKGLPCRSFKTSSLALANINRGYSCPGILVSLIVFENIVLALVEQSGGTIRSLQGNP